MAPMMPNLRMDARTEAARIAEARALVTTGDADALTQLESGGAWVHRSRRNGLRRALAGRALFVWRITIEDGNGRLVASHAMAALVAVDRRRMRVRDVAAEILICIQPRVRRRILETEEAARLSGSVLLTRARSTSPPRATPPAFQPGLFDRRAERTRGEAAATADDEVRDDGERLAAIEQAMKIGDAVPRLLFVVVP